MNKKMIDKYMDFTICHFFFAWGWHGDTSWEGLYCRTDVRQGCNHWWFL